jgi:hypothetical protein
VLKDLGLALLFSVAVALGVAAGLLLGAWLIQQAFGVLL